jgi:chromate transporter
MKTARPPLGRLLRLALWLGCIGFGGGYAVLAQSRRDLVERKRWLDDEEYSELVTVAQSLPGAVGANFFTLLGLRNGVGGAALAAACFLLPSVALMVTLGVSYPRFHGIERLQSLIAALNMAVVGVVAAVALQLGRRTRRWWQLGLIAAACVAVELHVPVALVVGGAIVVGLLRAGVQRLPPLLLVPLPKLALTFLHLGAISFGGGMAMVPLLEREIVTRLGWLSMRELADAITFGQITPGPVAICTTFVGYRLRGLIGAGVATLATFLPPFLATVAAGHSLAAFRRSKVVLSVLAVLEPAIAGVVAAAALSLGRASLHSPYDIAIAAATFVAVGLLRAPTLLALTAAAILRMLFG